MMICMGMLVSLAPASAKAEGLDSAAQNQTTGVVNAPAKPALSDFGILNFQNEKARVVWSHKAPATIGAAGFQIQVSQVKDGKIVKENELDDFFTAKRDVLYRYCIRYYNQEFGSSQKVYGEWSDYRYFYVPSLSGKRTAKGFQIKWKKAAGAKGYDCYVQAAKSRNARSAGKMVYSTFPARNMSAEGYKKIKSLGKNSTSFSFTKVGKQAVSLSNYYYVIVRPRLYVGGKKVTNDLDSWVYR